MPADGMSAAREKGTSARPAGSSRTKLVSVPETYMAAPIIGRGCKAQVRPTPTAASGDAVGKDLLQLLTAACGPDLPTWHASDHGRYRRYSGSIILTLSISAHDPNRPSTRNVG